MLLNVHKILALKFLSIAIQCLQQGWLRSDMPVMSGISCRSLVLSFEHALLRTRLLDLLDRIRALNIYIWRPISKILQVVVIQRHLLVWIDRATGWREYHITHSASVDLRFGWVSPSWWFLFNRAEWFELCMTRLEWLSLRGVVGADSLLVASCHVSAALTAMLVKLLQIRGMMMLLLTGLDLLAAILSLGRCRHVVLLIHLTITVVVDF